MHNSQQIKMYINRPKNELTDQVDQKLDQQIKSEVNWSKAKPTDQKCD